MNECGRPVHMSYDVISFFSGCGGLDLGFSGGFDYKGDHFEPLPFRIIKAYDKDPKCVETYNKNLWSVAEVVDLEDYPVATMPKASVVLGGFPCQDFSSCGPKVGLHSKRGQLYKILVNYMIAHQPDVVVAENVPHLARMRNGTVLDTIVTDLESAGYVFDVWYLFAPDFGVPQRRRRLFLVGVRKGIDGFPAKPERVVEQYRSIDWAIGDLVAVTDDRIPNQSQYFAANKAKNGNGQGDEKNKPGYPAYTIRANPKSRIQFHYSLDRRLTIRECARLQTFPDTFEFPHSPTTNLSQIGNAVPPVLAYYVGKSIAQYLDEIRRW